MSYLNLSRVPRSPVVDDQRFTLFAHDWRLGPAHEWRDRHLAQELWGRDISSPSSLRPASPRQASPGWAPVTSASPALMS
jgi:hypothetical protein